MEQGTAFSLRQFCYGFVNYFQVVKPAREQKVGISLGHTADGTRAENKRLLLRYAESLQTPRTVPRLMINWKCCGEALQ
jgi:hypothetical protein